MKIILITPPFTQLNAPYPATPQLKGFLKQHGYDVFQVDLGIELINAIFSRKGLEELFSCAEKSPAQISQNSLRIIKNEQYYLQTIEQVMSFLQYRDDTLARLICSEAFLPRASRFDQLPDLEWSFGNMGVNDKARFLATLYIEDIGDLIKDAVTPYFGFSRYAEKLGLSAHSFAALDHALQQPEQNIIATRMLDLLQSHIERFSPDVAGITIPFPGNLYAGLKCAQYIKKNFGAIKVVAGGGFVNTELRELSDPAVFNYMDFVTLDDGELPFLNILRRMAGDTPGANLKRTFLRVADRVIYNNDDAEKDLSHAETGRPDYSDLPLDQYLSLIELANPMHRLWSDGRWNKLALAHGCYWHQCSFCDTTLDYIKRCSAAPAPVLVDRIERVMDQTGQSGFHFVDEAASPSVLKELALELLRRRINISWWANIRFENAFTEDLCRLLAASGCTAVTGGLETASDRLLKLMNKGVTVRQAAQACRNFSTAGIMAHAYLMYGFPTETEQETINSLEIVRQFFEEGLVQSAFWHLFTATVHSDVGRNPEKYNIRIVSTPSGSFARNDLAHEDPAGCDHQAFAYGLNKAVYNFMHGIGLEYPVKQWFDFRVPPVSIDKHYTAKAISQKRSSDADRMNSKLLWLGGLPEYRRGPAGKERGGLVFYNKTEMLTLDTDPETGAWLHGILEKFLISAQELMSLQELKLDFEARFQAPFESFLKSPPWNSLRGGGLLLI